MCGSRRNAPPEAAVTTKGATDLFLWVLKRIWHVSGALAAPGGSRGFSSRCPGPGPSPEASGLRLIGALEPSQGASGPVLYYTILYYTVPYRAVL